MSDQEYQYVPNPDSDICFKYRGKYVDVISSYDGTWSVLYNNRRIAVGKATRAAGVEWFIDQMGSDVDSLPEVEEQHG